MRLDVDSSSHTKLFRIREAAQNFSTYIFASKVFLSSTSSNSILKLRTTSSSCDRLAHSLGELRLWLTANNVTIMTILLLVLGVAVIGKGLASF